jgi:hypothetical protein
MYIDPKQRNAITMEMGASSRHATYVEEIKVVPRDKKNFYILVKKNNFIDNTHNNTFQSPYEGHQ